MERIFKNGYNFIKALFMNQLDYYSNFFEIKINDSVKSGHFVLCIDFCIDSLNTNQVSWLDFFFFTKGQSKMMFLNAKKFSSDFDSYLVF